MIATTLILLLVLIGLSIPVGAALGVLGLILDPLYSMLPLTRGIGELAWSTNNEFLLVAIPLFILLGEILLRSGLAERMYGAMSLWLSWLPGGLMHANIGASALFAATSGSSVATAASTLSTATTTSTPFCSKTKGRSCRRFARGPSSAGRRRLRDGRVVLAEDMGAFGRCSGASIFSLGGAARGHPPASRTSGCRVTPIRPLVSPPAVARDIAGRMNGACPVGGRG